MHNKKLRDCKYHYNDTKTDHEIKSNTMLFITEGDSASGSITKTRDVKMQAVFSLRGKPLNSYGLTKKIAVQLLEVGVDVITLGNHAWDQKEMLSYISSKKNYLYHPI